MTVRIRPPGSFAGDAAMNVCANGGYPWHRNPTERAGDADSELRRHKSGVIRVGDCCRRKFLQIFLGFREVRL
jgi:hypothetical protein